MNDYNQHDEKPKRSTKSNFVTWFNSLTPTLKIIVPIVVVLMLVIIGVNLANPILNWFKGIFNTQPTVYMASSATLILGIKPLGELSTVSHQYAKAGIEVTLRYGPVCKIYTRHAAQAELKAGIDFDQITDEDIQFNEQTETYTIDLPAPRLTNCNFDPFSSEEYIRIGETLVCPADPDEMRMLATHEALTQFISDALEGGILDDAKFQADVAISGFVQALTGQNVIIRFKPDTQNELPPSCQSPITDIWKYDEAAKEWSKQG